MKAHRLLTPFVAAGLLCSGCATYKRVALEPGAAEQIEKTTVCRRFQPDPEHQAAILTLDPTHVTERDIRVVLSNAPAPRIINIHGGIYPVHRRMISFSEFLIGMGYPAASITNPGDGTYTFSCYESSRKIAGIIAWYYEREGLRPLIIGHSQGGMQVVKVLRRLAGVSARELNVWSPLTWKPEAACDIVDPLTGQRRPVVGLRLPFASSVGAGGLTRVLPNQWDMLTSLREVPDSVEEFTGFQKGKDLLGGDFLGYGPANLFHATGEAVVRNVRLPSSYKHGAIPDTKHLLQSQPIKDWINRYQPGEERPTHPEEPPDFGSDSKHILWAAEIWYSVKKSWVQELQRLIRAANNHA